METGTLSRPYRNSYEAAMRHSRWVAFWKYFIPVGTVLVIAGLVIWTWLKSLYRLDDVSVDNIQISGTQVTMEAPKLTGYSNKAQPYRVNALKAIQDLNNMNIVFLQKLDALFETDTEKSEIRIQADKGVYNTQTEYLEVEDNIIVTTESGQKLFMHSASIDMEAGTVRSVDPVQLIFPDGSIRANALEVFDNGDLVSFRKDVEAVFYKIVEPDSKTAEEEKETSPDSTNLTGETDQTN